MPHKLILHHVSQFTLLETVTTMIFDVKPGWRTRKPQITLVCVVIFFIPGIFMVTQGGSHILGLMDKYSAGFNVIVLSLLELAAITVIYGMRDV